MHIVVNACQHIAEPCNAALDPGAMNPMLSIAVNDSMAILSDLIERLSVRLELPIGQWLTELVVGHVPRDDWPALWRLSVWLGAMLHHAEDAAVTLQALMQFLAMGSIFETRRVGGEWLNEQGALAALDYYRRMPPQARMALQVDVSQACAYALLALAEASKARAEQAAAVADSMLAAHYLDAKDVVHLGVHSQIARRGGVFLSHRGKDAKRPLMDFHHAARPEIFLDIWARPAGDTNRRFLWRNLAAAGEMHAFVTANYAMSDFCMKEVEAWGVLSLARGHTAAETPGRFFVIDDAATGPANAVLCAWTQHCREDTTLTHAMTASAEALGSCGVLGTRIVHSMEEKDASDSFNRVLLGTDLLQDATLPVIELSREPIEALIGLFHRGLAILRNKGELSHELIRTIEHALPQEVLASGA
ncbi:MAG: hypothetical protein KDE58_38960, partial [Caldilineaceae bacterium]|nr:hypothetical protein [Caldilineaceae bacterium]